MSQCKDDFETTTSTNNKPHYISGKDDSSRTYHARISEQSTDAYSDKAGYTTSDCEADTESLAGEADHLLTCTWTLFVKENASSSDLLQDNIDGTVTFNETISSTETKKRKYDVNTTTYQLQSQKRRKIDSDAPKKGSFKVLNLTTQFDRDVLKQLRDRCKFLGIDAGFYKDVGGMSLLTTIVICKSELTRYENLTDMTVISLLEGQRTMLNMDSKCPYCRHKFEFNTNRPKSEETITDQIFSLVASKPGESQVFPGEQKENVEANPPPKKEIVE